MGRLVGYFWQKDPAPNIAQLCILFITAPRYSFKQGMETEVRGVHCDRMQDGGTNRHWEGLDDVLGHQTRLKRERVAHR